MSFWMPWHQTCSSFSFRLCLFDSKKCLSLLMRDDCQGLWRNPVLNTAYPLSCCLSYNFLLRRVYKQLCDWILRANEGQQHKTYCFLLLASHAFISVGCCNHPSMSDLGCFLHWDIPEHVVTGLLALCLLLETLGVDGQILLEMNSRKAQAQAV